VIFTAMAASAAVGNQATAWLLRRASPRTLLPAGAGLAAAAAFVFGAGPSPTVLLTAAALFGLGIGVATTVVYTTASHAVPAPDRGMAFGYLTTAYLVALAVSPVIAGFIGAAGMRTVFLVDGIGLALVAWTVRRRMGEA
jgi:MFS family permease